MTRMEHKSHTIWELSLHNAKIWQVVVALNVTAEIIYIYIYISLALPCKQSHLNLEEQEDEEGENKNRGGGLHDLVIVQLLHLLYVVGEWLKWCEGGGERAPSPPHPPHDRGEFGIRIS